MASEVAAHSVPGHPVLHWQPLASGKTLAQQLLRLKAAAHLADPAAAKRASAEVRAALSNGGMVEIAGYPIPAGLFHSMQASVLLPPPAGQAVRCIEVSPRTEAELLPATAKLMQAWAGDGLDVQSQVVAGPSFWQTQEIEVAPALLSATISALGLHPPTADLPA